MIIRKLGLSTRRLIVFAFDLLAIAVAFVGAFLLRFDFKIPDAELHMMLQGLPVVYLVQSAVFVTLGLYRGLWSFASLRDLFLILRATLLGVIASVAGIAIIHRHILGWPRSVFVLDAVLLILILGGGRFSYRMGREFVWNLRRKSKQILVIGAGQSGNLISREFFSRPELAARVVGFLDDNKSLKGVQIHGARVLGEIDTLSKWIEQLKPDEIIVAIPSLPGTRIKQIVSMTQQFNIPCRICPPIRDVLLGKIELNQLREVRVEDLLRRDVVQVNDAAIGSYLQGKSILITGAGGSIGSELCRQVLKYQPKCLVLYERSEFNLYRFEQELKNRLGYVGSTELVFAVGDILNESRLESIFSTHRPEIVLHAAAYKHVPLMEDNVYEALNNNVVGTHRLLETAVRHQVQTFVLISTDKAVRPTSVMGATKRMAELITQSARQRSKMKTVAVRFGNVLDSEGSVLPLFREQIARGGPVTVTDPRITRYFMTISEASSLVLQASILGTGGEVFLLDMGEPVLIRELAEELIKLSGLQPYKDIDIVFTGLRKGEKLYEELLINIQGSEKTAHPKIMVSTGEHRINLPVGWIKTLESFIQNGANTQEDELMDWVKAWVPEYKQTSDDLSAQIESSTSTTGNTNFLH